MLGRSRRPRSFYARKSSKSAHRVLRCEPLEPRIVLSGHSVWSWVLASSPRWHGATARAWAPNAAPTLAGSINVNGGAPITGRSALLSILGRDDGGEPNLIYTWSVAASPADGRARFNLNHTNMAKNTTVTFTRPGTYRLTVTIADRGGRWTRAAKTVVVQPTLTRITLSPNVACVLQGGGRQFRARAWNQFGRPMAHQQFFHWSALGGTISASGLFTAATGAGVCTVSATSGSVTGVAEVNVVANSTGLRDPVLAPLVSSLDADGSISRLDMIQILRSVAANGPVDATELGDLRHILNESASLNIPDYVQVLAGDIINGNLANATFQGQPLGNLTVGSSAAKLNKLINKWFYGADHPALGNSSLVYERATGSLFPQTPSHYDEFQGQLGDCYFISALGTLADSNSAAVQDMFIDNGDGTFTVRFYTGAYWSFYNWSDGSIDDGFQNGVGTADYVTVDRMLPTTPGGRLAYADYGANHADPANSLWIPLAEKAYAQWNETGKEGRDGKNAYASIEGGWMARVDAQVLGYNATDYVTAWTSEQVAIDALAANKAVTIATDQWSGTCYGLFGSHAYAITAYNPFSDTFTLYNPWGFDQPGPLTWGRLQAATSQFTVADASGSTPIAGAVSTMGTPGASWSDRASGPAHDALRASLVDAIFAADAMKHRA